MLSRYAAILLMLAAASPLAAQTAAPLTDAPAPRTAYYVELGGNGGFYSLNAERRVGPRGVLRAGVSAVPLTDSQGGFTLGRGGALGLTMPLTAGVLLGDGTRVLELAAGMTLTSAGIVGDSEGSTVRALGTATVGVRWAPSGSPLLLRAAFTPLVDGRGEVWPMVGLSVGVRR